jgi:sugar phosphate isomerase/epimerase
VHIGIQTISWGAHDVNVGEMIGAIRDCGYEGAEFAQSPKMLGPAADFYRRLQEHGIVFLGLAGGSLRERIEFVAKYEELASPTWRPYVYLDEWDETVERDVQQADLVFAVHPHMFKPIQTTRDAVLCLSRHDRKKLRLLPDSAHLTVAGENVIEVLERFLDRIDAIHLKDWTPAFGRAYQFYSRGFVGLGEGDVPLPDVINWLRVKRFDGWIIVEQDPVEDPVTNAKRNREWLGQRLAKRDSAHEQLP